MTSRLHLVYIHLHVCMDCKYYGPIWHVADYLIWLSAFLQSNSIESYQKMWGEKSCFKASNFVLNSKTYMQMKNWVTFCSPQNISNYMKSSIQNLCQNVFLFCLNYRHLPLLEFSALIFHIFLWKISNFPPIASRSCQSHGREASEKSQVKFCRQTIRIEVSR